MRVCKFPFIILFVRMQINVNELTKSSLSLSDRSDESDKHLCIHPDKCLAMKQDKTLPWK